MIKDLPWPPPVGQLDGGASPPEGEAGPLTPAQHGPSQQSHEDTNGECYATGQRPCFTIGRISLMLDGASGSLCLEQELLGLQ